MVCSARCRQMKPNLASNSLASCFASYNIATASSTILETWERPRFEFPIGGYDLTCGSWANDRRVNMNRQQTEQTTITDV
ncbi:hypothetical protein B0H12DRAFT_721953 [Mycena haematopus]|nr:hypothetical protein B0H12DRAFT_721953 [Mycena haematopus]